MKSRVDELIKDNLIAAFVLRDAGVGAQLIPSSPLYGTSDDPGELGFKPISQ